MPPIDIQDILVIVLAGVVEKQANYQNIYPSYDFLPAQFIQTPHMSRAYACNRPLE
jgi:hypothetical protein